MSDFFEKEIKKKLGFGLMRLPKSSSEKDAPTDLKQVERMVDLFLEAGCSYFDTAYVYGSSEEDTHKALIKRHPRETFTLATKLHAPMAGSEKAAKEQFYTSLKRTGAEYFDFYLLHALMTKTYKKYEDYGIWDFVQAQKAKGLIRHIGFSYHADPVLLDRILTDHPEVEFVQLQINYADWESPTVCSRGNYEVARKHNKPIIVMEPVKGGALADPPEGVKNLFRSLLPEASFASWAIRFAASLDGVVTVLSGMSDVAQMQDNLSFMKNFRPLNETERETIGKAQDVLRNSSLIPCTACRYCVGGCPQKIDIPLIFAAANKYLDGGKELGLNSYQNALKKSAPPSSCVGCRRCERACPQQIPITEHLKNCAKLFES